LTQINENEDDQLNLKDRMILKLRTKASIH